MKTTYIILLSGLLFCACSQKQAASASRAVELVKAGRFAKWRDGSVSFAAKHDGSSLGDIQIWQAASDGLDTYLRAESGTVSPGPVDNSVKITLHHVKSVTGTAMEALPELTLVLQE